MEMVMESLEMAVEIDGVPRPGRVPEQRLLSPETSPRDGGGYETFSGKLPGVLGFSVARLFIVERAESGGGQGHHTCPWRGQGLAAPRGGGVARPWAPSCRLSVFWMLPGKIGTSAFVSSNSENISCVTFLKLKTAENRELALRHLVNRLVSEIV